MNDDLISRQAAIEAVEHITSSMSICVNTDECHGMKRMQRQAVIELANLPSAQKKRKKGKWIYNSPVTVKCDQCGCVIKDWDWYSFKYCPSCGAKLEVSE